MASWNSFLNLLSKDLRRVLVEAALEQPEIKARLQRDASYYIGAPAYQGYPDNGATAKEIALSFLDEYRYQATSGRLRNMASAALGRALGYEVSPIVSTSGGRRVSFADIDYKTDWGGLVRASARPEVMIRTAFLDAMKDSKMMIPFMAIASEWLMEGWDAAKWHEKAGKHINTALRMSLFGAMGRAIDVGLRHTGLPSQVSFFSEAAEEAYQSGLTRKKMEYLTGRSGGAANYITNSISVAMKEAVLRSVMGGMSQSALGAQARAFLGLNEQQVKSAMNFRLGLLGQKVPAGKVNQMVLGYSDNLLTKRADLMGRTEAFYAINEGRQITWMMAMQQGLLPPGTKKTWLTAPDERVCSVCKPLDGMTMQMNESFVTWAGVLPHPPAHPRCRCVIVPSTLVEQGMITRRARARGANLSTAQDLTHLIGV